MGFFWWPEVAGGEDGVLEGLVFGPVWGGGDGGDGVADDGFGEFAVGVEVGDDGGDFDGRFVGFPAVVIGDEGEGSESDLCFAGEACFAAVGHADDVEAEGSVHVGFGAGGEGGAVHAGVGAGGVEVWGVRCGGGDEDLAEGGGVGFGEGDVGGDAVSEEGVLVGFSGAIDELVGDD